MPMMSGVRAVLEEYPRRKSCQFSFQPQIGVDDSENKGIRGTDLENKSPGRGRELITSGVIQIFNKKFRK